ncbi:MAG: FAD-dependent oxidoreductase [Lachnospira sp.]
MKIIVIGSGISGLVCAIRGAEAGFEVTLCSPYPSERAQSVMAAGGINAVLDSEKSEDTIENHIYDTFKGGGFIDNKKSIKKLCEAAPDEVKWLSSIGVVFSCDGNGKILRRAFGGQSHNRTCFSGTSTGKQIVSALVYKCREYEEKGLVKRVFGKHFYSALIKDNVCYGCLLLDAVTGKLSELYGDALCMATGGQNQIFGKTTGSTLCDGYATGKLFEQGVVLRNLEFIQYHPTTLETPHKRMLISEAARGEGGRLFYEDNNTRRYFMEEMFGERGNLMPRDVVSKCIYDVKKQVYLDVSFLGEDLIHQRLEEIYDVCKRYAGLDITKQPIPVYPSVHFFMGGIDVDDNHMTNIRNLYAVGECASKYHGANRLGGNSLLAAIYSARACIQEIAANAYSNLPKPDFLEYVRNEEMVIRKAALSRSKYPVVYIERELADVMNDNLGITRNKDSLTKGIEAVDFYLDATSKLGLDPDISLYRNIRISQMLILSKAILISALQRRESRGAHIREEYPQKNAEFEASTLAEYHNGDITISYRKENDYEG